MFSVYLFFFLYGRVVYVYMLYIAYPFVKIYDACKTWILCVMYYALSLGYNLLPRLLLPLDFFYIGNPEITVMET